MENYKEMGGTKSGERGSLKPYQTSLSSLLTLNTSGPNNNNNADSLSCNDPQQPNYNISMCSLASLILLQKKLPPSPASCSVFAVEAGARQALKEKIISHPHFSTLLHSYLDCLKVGAPPEMEARLTAKWHEFQARQISFEATRDLELDQFMVEDLDLVELEACLEVTLQGIEARQISSGAPRDPTLDQFMEAYCEVLIQYRERIQGPVKETMEIMRGIESQLNSLIIGGLFPFDEDRKDMSDKAEDINKVGEVNREAEDGELKKYLLRKYSGHLSSLKQEVSKKRKVRKLPKKARLRLLSWWESHCKWPYPSESEKVRLAEATGLDEKQINNWFINQRKRHWKAPEDLKFMMMECIRSSG